MDSYSNGSPWQSPNLKKTLLKLFVVFFVLIVIIAGVIRVLAPKSAYDVSNSFVKDVLINNSTDSYQLTSLAFEKSTSAKRWATDVRTDSQDCNGTISLSAGKLTTTTAAYTAKITNSYGSCSMNLSLVKDGRSWEVDYFNPN